MSLKNKTTLGLVILVFLGLFYTACRLFSFIFTPVFLGAVMAYGYRPVNRFLKKKSLSPIVSALILAITTYALFAYSVIKIIPLLGTWSIILSSKFNFYRQALWDFINPLIYTLSKDSGPRIQEALDMLLKQGLQWASSLVMFLLHNGWSFGQMMLSFVLSPVIAFYLVKDGSSIRKRWFLLVPRPYRSILVLFLRHLDKALRQYFSGQIRVCLCLLVYYSIFLGGVLNLPGMLSLSIVTALLVFIPYIGFAISLFVACMVGIIDSGQWPYVGSIALVYMGGNILEALVLTPYLVGSRTGLHPLSVLLSILLGAALHGILGIILAIPISTVGAACWQMARRCYLKSDFYQNGFSKNMSSNDAGSLGSIERFD